MKTFKCVLIDKNGYVQELFYRRGKSKNEVLKGLKMFCWPKGKWIITLVD